MLKVVHCLATHLVQNGNHGQKTAKGFHFYGEKGSLGEDDLPFERSE